MNTHTPTEKQTLKTAGRPGQECAAFFLGERKQGQGAQARVILRKEAIPLERERRQNPRGKVHPRFLSLVRAFKCLWLMKLLGRTRMTTGSLGRTVFRRISKLGENLESICSFPSDSAENSPDITFCSDTAGFVVSGFRHSTELCLYYFKIYFGFTFVCVWSQICLCEFKFPGYGLMDGCKLPQGCWEPIPVVLEEQQVLPTTEPQLQASRHLLNNSLK